MTPSYRQTVEAEVAELESDLHWFALQTANFPSFHEHPSDIKGEIIAHKLELEALEVGV